MYKNRLADGSCNICGRKVARLRSGLSPKVSQRALAERMQLEGVDLDKNAIQRIECGKRFVTDIELRALAAIFKVPAEELLSEEGRRGGRNRMQRKKNAPHAAGRSFSCAGSAAQSR